MKKSGQCPKCACRDIVTDTKVLSYHNADVRIVTFSDPDAFIFKGQLEVSVSAQVCTQCGFVEFYADSPEALRE